MSILIFGESRGSEGACFRMTEERRTQTLGLTLSLLPLLLLGVSTHIPMVCATDSTGDDDVIPAQMLLENGVQVQLAVLDYGNTGVRGNWSNPVLQSANGRYQFSLQLADVGSTHFCWVAVVDKANLGKKLRWRAPCDERVEGSKCSLIATAGGDIQLVTGSGRVGWQSGTSGAIGVRRLQLNDGGNFTLENGDGTLVWQTDDYPTTPLCLIPGPEFVPSDDPFPGHVIAPSPVTSRQTRFAAGSSSMYSCFLFLLTFSLPILF